jgi:hypothetical protein
MNMKKLIVVIGLTATLSLSVLAQDAKTPPPISTNGVADFSFWQDTINWIAEGTNFIVVPYGIVTSGDRRYDAGGGVALAYAISDYVVTGMRFEYLNKAFYQASFSSQLQVPITLFRKFTVVPFVLGGVAVPFGGGAQDPGSVQGIAGTGLAVRLTKKIDLIGDVEKWSATSGLQYRFGVGYKF